MINALDNTTPVQAILYSGVTTVQVTSGVKKKKSETRVVSGETTLIIHNRQIICSCRKQSCCNAEMLSVYFAKYNVKQFFKSFDCTYKI